MSLTLVASDPSVSESEQRALAKLREGWRLVGPGCVVIEPPRTRGASRERWLHGAISQCAEVMETLADELYADHLNVPLGGRPQRNWRCPACAQVARLARGRPVMTATVIYADGQVHYANGHRPNQETLP